MARSGGRDRQARACARGVRHRWAACALCGRTVHAARGAHRSLARRSRKDTAALLTFYGENITYKDNQVPAGISGHAALKGYLDGLFGATPPMEYIPEATWPIEGGYCGRWNCAFTLPDGSRRAIRDFDLVLMEGDKISYNEVYTHNLPG